MPTGYTQPLYEGKDISFSDFIKRCAHAFIIHLRDEDVAGDIPHEAPKSTYESKRLMEEQIRLKFYTDMSDEDAEQGARDRYAEDLEVYEQFATDNQALRERYTKMLNQAKDWEVPSDLQGLKDFMIQQLESSISYDTDMSLPAPTPKTAEEYKKSQIAMAQRAVDYATQDFQKAAERHASNQRWINALWDAMPKEA